MVYSNLKSYHYNPNVLWNGKGSPAGNIYSKMALLIRNLWIGLIKKMAL